MTIERKEHLRQKAINQFKRSFSTPWGVFDTKPDALAHPNAWLISRETLTNYLSQPNHFITSKKSLCYHKTPQACRILLSRAPKYIT